MKIPGKKAAKATNFLTPGTPVLYKHLEPGGRPEFSGQRAEVVRDFDCDEAIARVGLRLYKIRFEGGETANAYAKELTRV